MIRGEAVGADADVGAVQVLVRLIGQRARGEAMAVEHQALAGPADRFLH